MCSRRRFLPQPQSTSFRSGRTILWTIVPFDLKRLQAIVGNEPVELPLSLPLPVQEALKRSGQFVPTFYDCEWSILDASAEDRQLEEMHPSRWVLLPQGPITTWTETPASIVPYLGQRLPYRMKREPYAIRRRLAEDLKPIGSLTVR